jgi:2-polyprenyl-3-methyl-5-hydroxy-6-metoxy-1,4-benzoquinol methylase
VPLRNEKEKKFLSSGRAMVNDRFQFELDKYYSYPDNCVRYTHRLRINQIQKLISNISNRHGQRGRAKALDAGCCHGVYSILLAEAGYDVLGIDINEEEIRRAYQWVSEKGLENKITFQVGDIQNIDHGDSIFDLVICSEVLEHLDDPNDGASELYRVLKPNGKAIISMPNMACLFGLLQWTYRASGIRSLLGKPPLDTFQIQHSRYWFGNIQKLLKNNGFWIDHKYSTSHFPYLWEVDAFLEKLSTTSSFTYMIEGSIGTLPLLKYLGFNFIVVARKPAADSAFSL